MRVPPTLFGLAVLLAAVVAAPAADEPAPLLKPVTPAGSSLRVRLPVVPGYPKTMQFPAQVPNGKKKSDLLTISVAFDSLPNPSYVTAKKLESWGYEVPKNKEFLLPELFFTTAQIAPKPAKGHDVVVRLTNIKLTVIDSPASSDNTIYNCDMSLSALAVYYGSERMIEPRLSFADKFLELTVPSTIVKRPGTEDTPVPEVSTTTDATLVTAVGPMVVKGRPVFAYAAVNTQEAYKTANGTIVPVHVAVASINNWEPGIVLTMGLARGCKVEMDQAATGMMGTGVESKTEMIPGKMKEFRLGLLTGPGLKTQKDLVLKDVPVVVDKNISEGGVTIGQKFIDTYFKDGVYAGDANGWKLHGRVNPDVLFDIKSRKKFDPKQ
jgi:hypothetical protein